MEHIGNTRRTTRIRRQMWLDPPELCVREAEPIPIDPCVLPEVVNHAEPATPATLWV